MSADKPGGSNAAANVSHSTHALGTSTPSRTSPEVREGFRTYALQHHRISRVIANKVNQRSALPRFQPAKQGVWPLVRRACPAQGFHPVLQIFLLGQQARQPATE